MRVLQVALLLLGLIAMTSLPAWADDVVCAMVTPTCNAVFEPEYPNGVRPAEVCYLQDRLFCRNQENNELRGLLKTCFVELMVDDEEEAAVVGKPKKLEKKKGKRTGKNGNPRDFVALD